jgi:polyferredoxin
MCPFGGMQEFITKVGGLNVKVSGPLEKVLRGMVYLLLWFALMIIFITRNPALGNFEPFATLFSLRGLGVQWYLVTVALLGAFAIPKFWCRFFCPVGGFLKQVVWLKRALSARFRLPVASRKELLDEEKIRC